MLAHCITGRSSQDLHAGSHQLDQQKVIIGSVSQFLIDLVTVCLNAVKPVSVKAHLCYFTTQAKARMRPGIKTYTFRAGQMGAPETGDMQEVNRGGLPSFPTPQGFPVSPHLCLPSWRSRSLQGCRKSQLLKKADCLEATYKEQLDQSNQEMGSLK